MDTLKNRIQVNDEITLCPSRGLYLKPFALLHITVELPTLWSKLKVEKDQCIPIGNSISNREVIDQLKLLILPESFMSLKVTENDLQQIKLDGEFEIVSKARNVMARLNGQQFSLRNVNNKFKVTASLAKDDMECRREWESFFRNSSLMNELKPGERPDTMHLMNVPIKWFSPSGEMEKSELAFREVFSKFGCISRTYIPTVESTDDICDVYIQYREYEAFVRAMEFCRNTRLIYRPSPDAESQTAAIKVDYDRTKQLSDMSVRHRAIIREKMLQKEKKRKGIEFIKDEIRKRKEFEAELEKLRDEQEIKDQEDMKLISAEDGKNKKHKHKHKKDTKRSKNKKKSKQKEKKDKIKETNADLKETDVAKPVNDSEQSSTPLDNYLTIKIQRKIESVRMIDMMLYVLKKKMKQTLRSKKTKANKMKTLRKDSNRDIEEMDAETSLQEETKKPVGSGISSKQDTENAQSVAKDSSSKETKIKHQSHVENIAVKSDSENRKHVATISSLRHIPENENSSVKNISLDQVNEIPKQQLSVINLPTQDNNNTVLMNKTQICVADNYSLNNDTGTQNVFIECSDHESRVVSNHLSSQNEGKQESDRSVSSQQDDECLNSFVAATWCSQQKEIFEDNSSKQDKEKQIPDAEISSGIKEQNMKEVGKLKSSITVVKNVGRATNSVRHNTRDNNTDWTYRNRNQGYSYRLHNRDRTRGFEIMRDRKFNRRYNPRFNRQNFRFQCKQRGTWYTKSNMDSSEFAEFTAAQFKEYQRYLEKLVESIPSDDTDRRNRSPSNKSGRSRSRKRSADTTYKNGEKQKRSSSPEKSKRRFDDRERRRGDSSNKKDVRGNQKARYEDRREKRDRSRSYGRYRRHTRSSSSSGSSSHKRNRSHSHRSKSGSERNRISENKRRSCSNHVVEKREVPQITTDSSSIISTTKDDNHCG